MKLATSPRKVKRLKRRFARVAILGIATLILWIGYLAGSIYFYGSQITTESADAAIVLGAAVWDTEPSPVFRERINHAITLYKTNQVKNVIFTVGQGEVTEQAESIVAKDYAIERGVAAANILTETQSRTTFQNLYYAKQEAEDNQLSQFLIVSDPLHMKRAMLMAQDLDMKAKSSPTLTTRYKSLSAQSEFLRRETLFYSLYLIKRLFEMPAQNPHTF